MRISDGSSDVCSSDLNVATPIEHAKKASLGVELDYGFGRRRGAGCQELNCARSVVRYVRRSIHVREVSVIEMFIEPVAAIQDLPEEGVSWSGHTSPSVPRGPPDAAGESLTRRSEERRVGKEFVSTCNSR